MNIGDIEMITSVLDRAYALFEANEMTRLASRDRLDLMIDLDNAIRTTGLRLKDLYAADDFNFMHDIVGIVDNTNRRTGVIENGFIPRFAGKG